MALSKKEMADSYARTGQYKQDLLAVRQGHGVRSAKDLSRLLNAEEKTYSSKKASYDQASATIDSVRPKYPQLLLPIRMDETTAPALSPVPASPVAAVSNTVIPPNAASNPEPEAAKIISGREAPTAPQAAPTPTPSGSPQAQLSVGIDRQHLL